jgi:CheY-like chemotaxis protein
VYRARLKDEFLATMSHELRTPLTGVLSAADVLGEQVHGALNARQLDAVRMISESGKRLLELINGILDLSKIEAGDMALSMYTVGVDDVCSAALTIMRNEAERKNLVVSYSSTPAMLNLVADPVRLRQILVNLLSNAVKFTPGGGSIGLEVFGDAPNEKVHFVVWDTGIGIASEQQSLVFEPFVQLDGGLSRQFSGAGLGLALVRKFAELHGGGVAVESSPGQGSRFTVTLPWQPVVLPAADVKPASNHSSNHQRLILQLIETLGRKPLILLAEDSRAGIDITLNYLEPLGCEMLVVLRGDDAVRTASEREPDLILMDIQLPYLDGITAITQIRSHSNPKVARTPILAVTALAMTDDRERCLAAGANDYLSKPFSMAALVEAIFKLVITSWVQT